MKNYKKYQIKETKKEIKRMIKNGLIFLDPVNFENELKRLELRINYKVAYKYFNNLNKNHYLEINSCIQDLKTNHSFANINGKFYKTHRNKKDQLYKDFNHFRNNYFTVIKDHILSI